MIIISIAFFYLLINPIFINCHDDDVYTIKFNNENFSYEIQKTNHFVMFYAPWCGHCKKFGPTWEQLAELLNQDDNNIKIAKVDCTISSEVCAQNDITGYPTLKFFKQGENEGIRFRGTRDLPSLTTFINEHLRVEGDRDSNFEIHEFGGLFELTDENFDKHVATGKHFVKFYAPWCGHCQILAPTWEQLAKSLIGTDVNIAKIDCTVYRSVCNSFDVRGYPTLLWIEDGKRLDKYQGNRNLNDLKEYVNNMRGSSKDEDSETDDSNKIDNLEELTAETFDNAIQKGVAFVKFFAPWCGHCKRLSPTWNSLREKFHNHNIVNIFKVDCNSESNKDLCNSEKIDSFPTLFIYKDGVKISEYVGTRSIEDLTDFVNKHIGHDEL